MRKCGLFVAIAAVLLGAAIPAQAVDFITGASFTLAGAQPSACPAGAKVASPRGYSVLALGQGECGCVDTYVQPTSQLAWTIAPLISVGTAAPTNDDGCIEASISVYVDGADLTTIGTPTGAVIEDDDVSAGADVARYLAASAPIAIYDVDGDAACTLPACTNKIARVCLKRLSTGICSTNEYADDILIEAIIINKAP